MNISFTDKTGTSTQSRNSKTHTHTHTPQVVSLSTPPPMMMGLILLNACSMCTLHTVCGKTIGWTLTLIKFPHCPMTHAGGGGGVIWSNNQSAVGDFSSAVRLRCTCSWRRRKPFTVNTWWWTISSWPTTSTISLYPSTKSRFHQIQPLSSVKVFKVCTTSCVRFPAEHLVLSYPLCVQVHFEKPSRCVRSSSVNPTAHCFASTLQHLPFYRSNYCDHFHCFLVFILSQLFKGALKFSWKRHRSVTWTSLTFFSQLLIWCQNKPKPPQLKWNSSLTWTHLLFLIGANLQSEDKNIRAENIFIWFFL